MQHIMNLFTVFLHCDSGLKTDTKTSCSVCSASLCFACWKLIGLYVITLKMYVQLQCIKTYHHFPYDVNSAWLKQLCGNQLQPGAKPLSWRSDTMWVRRSVKGEQGVPTSTDTMSLDMWSFFISPCLLSHLLLSLSYSTTPFTFLSPLSLSFFSHSISQLTTPPSKKKEKIGRRQILQPLMASVFTNP